MIVWTYPDERGVTLQHHWEQLEKSPAYEKLKDKIERPAEVEVPIIVEHIWHWFWELRQTAFIPGLGQTALSFTEIKDWAGLLGVELEPTTVRMLRAMDEAYLTSLSKEQTKRRKVGKSS